MPKLAANLSMMFNEVPFVDRFLAASAAGFKGVEYLHPYSEKPGVIAGLLEEHGLTQVLFNLPPGDWDAGDRGLAGQPDRVAEFRDGVETAIDYAITTGCRRLHAMTGLAPDGVTRTHLDTLADNVRFLADRAAVHGIDVMIEAINSRVDIPGYIVDSTARALEVLDAVDRSNVRLQYDIYHCQVTEGDLARTIESLLPRIGHMQLADNPGRNEPGTGEINYPWLLNRIDELGYDGWIGCEYRPRNGTVDGLGWARPYL